MKAAGRAQSGRRWAGVSLIELVVVMVIASLVAVGVANLMQHPMDGQIAVDRRASLVAFGDAALGRMVDDIENALPRSVRISTDGNSLELMRVTSAGPYRAAGGVNDPGGAAETDHSAAGDVLNFSSDTSFNVLGRLSPRPIDYGATFTSGTRIAIAPASAATAWSDAASSNNPGSITPAATDLSLLDDTDEDQITLSSAHTFSGASPNRRFHVVEGPVTWVCDTADDSLWRIDGYTMQTSQPTDRSASPLSSGNAARAADLIETCAFGYVAGETDRGGLVTINITLASGGERIRHARTVEVRHAP